MEHHIISPLQPKTARIRASFYADDAALFVNPLKEDISTIQHLLQLFGSASGLCTNIKKCVAYAVACDENEVPTILQEFGGSQGSLPCKYLGLP
jgi:hypothetical protein